MNNMKGGATINCQSLINLVLEPTGSFFFSAKPGVLAYITMSIFGFVTHFISLTNTTPPLTLGTKAHAFLYKTHEEQR